MLTNCSGVRKIGRGEGRPSAAGLSLTYYDTDTAPPMVENRTICTYMDCHAYLCLRI
jgi:hypothetical protein